MIWSSIKLFPHIHGYLIIFTATEIYVNSIKLIEKLSRRHLINCVDVFNIWNLNRIKNKLKCLSARGIEKKL